MTGYRAFAEFGAAENGVSFGRHKTSAGVDFTAMSARTFGVDNPATTAQFEQGKGKTNAYPKVGPIVINEIMYHPAETNSALEYVELHNITDAPQALYDPANPQNTWRMRQGIDLDFPTNIVIPAKGFLVLVSFDPATDPASRVAFESKYGATWIPLVGPYLGNLANSGEEIELRKPDAPQTLPGPDFGLVPYITVDRVVYGTAAPWPVTPDGQGAALARALGTLYGNDPANWLATEPTPGRANFNINNLQLIGIDRVTGGGMRLTWSSQTGKTYQVQSTTSLSAGSWGNLSQPIPATGATASYTDTTPGTQKFYRVRQLD